LEGILRSKPGSPEWMLYAAAAFDSIVEYPHVLVDGGGGVASGGLSVAQAMGRGATAIFWDTGRGPG